MNEEEYFEQLCSNSVDGTLTEFRKAKSWKSIWQSAHRAPR